MVVVSWLWRGSWRETPWPDLNGFNQNSTLAARIFFAPAWRWDSAHAPIVRARSSPWHEPSRCRSPRRRQRMHTSQSFAAEKLRRREPHGSLPPCGGGTGRGVATAHDPASAHRSQKSGESWSSFAAVPVVPPSLSLPHMGGGNAVAPLFHTSHAAFAFVSKHVCM